MPLSVPGNSSRSFQTYLEAVTQPRGWFQFGWTPEDPYLRNTKYEAGLIQFDRAYCTAVCGIDGSNSIPTLDYFFDSVLPIMERPTRVTDVGCGQGEFVRALRDQGVEAVGFDPVLQESCSYLFAELWSADLTPDTNLIVMRCVLPHIADPWSFLAEVALKVSILVSLKMLNGVGFFDPKSYRPYFNYEFSLGRELVGVLDARGRWLGSQANKKVQRCGYGGRLKELCCLTR